VVKVGVKKVKHKTFGDEGSTCHRLVQKSVTSKKETEGVQFKQRTLMPVETYHELKPHNSTSGNFAEQTM
jgi:hypothetical protein